MAAAEENPAFASLLDELHNNNSASPTGTRGSASPTGTRSPRSPSFVPCGVSTTTTGAPTEGGRGI